MQVTTEDGGLLNAFAKEPRMEVMDQNASRDRNRSSLMSVLLVPAGVWSEGSRSRR
jgi:hypothetical protein